MSCAGCDADLAEVRRQQPLPIETDQPAPAGPDYYPEDNRIGNPAGLRPVTEEELTARREAHFAAAQYRHSAAGWLERMVPHASAQTFVIIGRLSEDRGTKYGPDSHTALVDVVECVAGSKVAAAQIEVVQDATHGQLGSCGGLHWAPGLTVALVLEPASIAGAYRVLAPSMIEDSGWAIQTGEDEFRAYGGVILDRSALATLGGTP